MADDWTGYPIGFQPPALDPYHLDFLGWLNPYVVSDSSMIHTVTVVQTSKSPGSGYRGVKIPLPDGVCPSSGSAHRELSVVGRQGKVGECDDDNEERHQYPRRRCDS